MKGKFSDPDIFIDPELANPFAQRPRQPQKPAQPAAPPNPARMAEELHKRCQAIPGWQAFALACAKLQHWTSTPGWEDNGTDATPPKQTQPNAKPIGLAQWGMALATAGMIAESVAKAGLPDPGVDPLGFIWLYWNIGDCQFALELHDGMLSQSYKWRRVIDGLPREHMASSLGDVIEALRTFVESATRRAA